jgi:hypothetical protein
MTLAVSTRARISHACGAIPVDLLNARGKWLTDSPQVAATSRSEVAPERSPAISSLACLSCQGASPPFERYRAGLHSSVGLRCVNSESRNQIIRKQTIHLVQACRRQLIVSSRSCLRLNQAAPFGAKQSRRPGLSLATAPERDMGVQHRYHLQEPQAVGFQGDEGC